MLLLLLLFLSWCCHSSYSSLFNVVISLIAPCLLDVVVLCLFDIANPLVAPCFLDIVASCLTLLLFACSMLLDTITFLVAPCLLNIVALLVAPCLLDVNIVQHYCSSCCSLLAWHWHCSTLLLFLLLLTCWTLFDIIAPLFVVLAVIFGWNHFLNIFETSFKSLKNENKFKNKNQIGFSKHFNTQIWWFPKKLENHPIHVVLCKFNSHKVRLALGQSWWGHHGSVGSLSHDKLGFNSSIHLTNGAMGFQDQNLGQATNLIRDKLGLFRGVI